MDKINSSRPDYIKETVEILEHLENNNIPYKNDITGIPYSLWERILLFSASDNKLFYLLNLPNTNNASAISTGNFNVSKEQTASEGIELKGDQPLAWAKLLDWLKRDDPYFIIKGVAGTGKSFLMKLLSQLDFNIEFTAPTNKATGVLSDFIGKSCKTTYSLFGFKMIEKEEEMVLKVPDHLPFLSKGTIIVIDEASMLNKKLVKFIEKVRKKFGLRVIYCGDPLQLNPIGEKKSKSWKVTKDERNIAVLKKVIRFDDELLDLSIKIRKHIRKKKFTSPIETNYTNKKDKGVFVLTKNRFMDKIFDLELEDFKDKKVVAWRNKIVNEYNDDIRENLGFKEKFEPNDIIMIATPVEIDNKIVAYTDDEGQVTKAVKSHVTIEEYDIRVWDLVLDMKRRKSLRLRIPRSEIKLNEILLEKSNLARQAKDRAERQHYWDEFWSIKKQFHSVRYGYAMTLHRIQGTTTNTIFVDQNDIFANKNKMEAMRGLYVACTRPSKFLYTY